MILIASNSGSDSPPSRPDGQSMIRYIGIFCFILLPSIASAAMARPPGASATLMTACRVERSRLDLDGVEDAVTLTCSAGTAAIIRVLAGRDLHASPQTGWVSWSNSGTVTCEIYEGADRTAGWYGDGEESVKVLLPRLDKPPARAVEEIPAAKGGVREPNPESEILSIEF